MRSRHILVTIVLFTFWISPIQAQSNNTDMWLIWIIDRMGEEIDEETLQDRLSILESYLITPLSISIVDRSTLQAFELFTDEEIDLILDWIQQTELTEISEVNFRKNVSINEMTKEFFLAITTFDDRVRHGIAKKWWKMENGRFKGLSEVKFGTVFPVQAGYRADGNYIGPRFTIREQYVIQKDILSARFSRYKMAGEPVAYPLKMGPWTASITYNNPTSVSKSLIHVRTIVIGDHRFRAGHGLLASTGTMRADGNRQQTSNITASPITANGASPSGKFHRGIAFWATAGAIEMALSLSVRRLSSSTTDSLYYAPGWANHVRTENDLNNHQNIRLKSVSMMARRQLKAGPIIFNLGMAAVGYRFSEKITKRPGFSYMEDFQGGHDIEWSVFGSSVFQSFAYTMEIGRANDKTGWIQAISVQSAPLSLSVWARRYPFGFDSRFGNPVAAFGPTNESGIGAWIRIRSTKWFSMMAWTDRYASLGPRYGTRLPVKGLEWGVRIESSLGAGRRLEGSIRFRNRLENEVLTDLFERQYDYRIWNESRSAKIAFYNPLNANLTVKLQVSYSEVNKVGNRLIGWGSSALLTVKLNSFKLYAQTSMFSSEDHESRSFFYEYDMIGSFRIPAFSGYGHRSYVLGEVELIKGLLIRTKIGLTEYVDRQVIGTGADASTGTQRWNVDVQMRWLF